MITVTEAYQLDDFWCVRYSDTPAGRAKVYSSPIDALLSYVTILLGGGRTSWAIRVMNISTSAVHRVRHDRQRLPEEWILWAHEITGADLASLRIISNTKPRSAA